MIIDLSSPIELRKYELLHDDAGTTRAYLVLFNVSYDTVTGYSGTVHWSRDDTDDSVNDHIAVDQIAIPGGAEFKLSISTSNVKFADRLEIYFDRVSFEDRPDWTPTDGDLVNVGEQRELEGQELTLLKSVAGEDAVMYPETQDKFWRCVCGRINPLEADECARCLREREYVLKQLNRKTVSLSPGAEREREKRIRRAENSRKRAVEAEKSTRIYSVIMACAACAFVLLAVIMAIKMK